MTGENFFDADVNFYNPSRERQPSDTCLGSSSGRMTCGLLSAEMSNSLELESLADAPADEGVEQAADEKDTTSLFDYIDGMGADDKAVGSLF